MLAVLEQIEEKLSRGKKMLKLATTEGFREKIKDIIMEAARRSEIC